MLLNEDFWSNENVPVLLTLLELFLNNEYVDVNSSNPIDGYTILHTAVRKITTSFLQVILKCTRVDVNIAEHYRGDTALHMACSRSDIVSVKLLLSTGRVNPNPLKKNRVTPLYILITGPQHKLYTLQMAEMLLKKGGNPNLTYTDFGETLLHLCYDQKMCQLLLSYGADPLIKCNGERRKQFLQNRGVLNVGLIPQNAIQKADYDNNYGLRNIMVEYVMSKKPISPETIKMIEDLSEIPGPARY
jgi:hypothetical protein